MKKLHYDIKLIKAKVAYDRHRRSIKRRRKRQEKIEHFARFRRLYRNRASDLIDCDSQYIPLVVPKTLSLSENRGDTIVFINEIRKIVLNERLPIYLHFSNCEKIGASAAVVLSAEIFRCRYLRRFRNRKSVHGEYPLHHGVRDMLTKMGFFDSIEVTSPIDNGEDSEESYIKIQSFTNVNGALVKEVAEQLTFAFPHFSDDSKRRMYGAVVEGLGNIFEHAFDVAPPFPIWGRRGWLGAVVNPSGNQFTLMVFDQGAGIPSTLPLSVVEQLKALGQLRGSSDGDVIAAATRLRRTSTRQSGRGKGFETMRRFIDSCDDGELRVYSNRGAYLYQGEGEHILTDVDDTLGGTLVLWRIRHAGESLNVPEQ